MENKAKIIEVFTAFPGLDHVYVNETEVFVTEKQGTTRLTRKEFESMNQKKKKANE